MVYDIERLTSGRDQAQKRKVYLPSRETAQSCEILRDGEKTLPIKTREITQFMIYFLHRAIGAYNFVAIPIPTVDLLVVIEFYDLAQLTDVFYSTVYFKAAHTSCICLRNY